jgi:hypothetical protein
LDTGSSSGPLFASRAHAYGLRPRHDAEPPRGRQHHWRQQHDGRVECENGGDARGDADDEQQQARCSSAARARRNGTEVVEDAGLGAQMTEHQDGGEESHGRGDLAQRLRGAVQRRMPVATSAPPPEPLQQPHSAPADE